MASINDYLPLEVLVKIFSYYAEAEGPLKFLRNVSPVCKLWNDLSSSYPLWKEVSWKSLKWNSVHLLKLGERGFLTQTRTLNLSLPEFPREESKMNKSDRLKLKIEDFLQLIDCCHNLKVLDVSLINFMDETILQFIARKCPEYERFIVDPVNHECEPECEHSNMVSIDDGNKMITKSLLINVQEKRHSDLRLRFANDGRIISKTSDCCPFLEELYLIDVHVDDIGLKLLFRVGEIQRGCLKLRVLEIFNCNLGWSNDEELEGFKELRIFSAVFCFFLAEDVGKLFNNFTELESLKLSDCRKAKKNNGPKDDVRAWEKVTFSVGEIQKGCPKLRVFEIYYCDLECSNDKELEGFKEIRKFSAEDCNFRGLDVGKILKNSTKLEDLQLKECDDLELAHATEIPSEKVNSLEIDLDEELSERLEKMVKKWRLTLKNLWLELDDSWRLTRVLKALLHDNHNTVIEKIYGRGYVDAPFIKSLIHDCPNLSYLQCSHDNRSSYGLETREELEEYAESL